MLKADGFDEAIIGVTYDMVVQKERLIYSVDKCVEILVKRDEMTSEEAIEYMDFNVLGAYIGKDQPVFLSEYEE
jgi:hypothetical protein|tara:strand:- start:428 stop:649 length:222 start_codon:yes stop_codon:yes gene_type:complete